MHKGELPYSRLYIVENRIYILNVKEKIYAVRNIQSRDPLGSQKGIIWHFDI